MYTLLNHYRIRAYLRICSLSVSRCMCTPAFLCNVSTWSWCTSTTLSILALWTCLTSSWYLTSDWSFCPDCWYGFPQRFTPAKNRLCLRHILVFVDNLTGLVYYWSSVMIKKSHYPVWPRRWRISMLRADHSPSDVWCWLNPPSPHGQSTILNSTQWILTKVSCVHTTQRERMDITALCCNSSNRQSINLNCDYTSHWMRWSW